MCGFLFYGSTAQKPLKDISKSLLFLSRRGPDQTNIVRIKEKNVFITMSHSLLDISGQGITQPIKLNDNRYLLFNGEIYSTPEQFSSDSEYLQKLFMDKDPSKESLESIKGEFAICVVDLQRQKVIFSSDCFMTKPMFFAFDNKTFEFGVSSYESPLRSLGFCEKSIHQCEPNSIHTIDYCKSEISHTVVCNRNVYEFSLHQDHSTFEHFIDSFIEAVRVRGTHGNGRLYVPLSSGYDSGAICAALNFLKIPYSSYSFESGEDIGILKSRIDINLKESCVSSHILKPLTTPQIDSIKRKIQSDLEPLQYFHLDSPGSQTPIHLFEDAGAVGAYNISEVARDNSFSVCLSGTGADEIYSDYGHNGVKFCEHSQFGGKFPKQLEGFFPWDKFYDDTQRSYIFKEEYILGNFGIEGRHPFLDYNVVQAFLSLNADLKNLEYKSPIAALLRKLSYPFEPDIKRGFNPNASKMAHGSVRKAVPRLKRWAKKKLHA